MNAILSGGQARQAGFPRLYRLTGTDDFSSVFGFRKAVKSTNFLLHYRPRERAESARLGLVVAKRHLRRSVDRNLVKRLTREVFRKQRPELPPCDLIVRLAMKLPVPLDRRALTEEIQHLLEKIRIRS